MEPIKNKSSNPICVSEVPLDLEGQDISSNPRKFKDKSTKSGKQTITFLDRANSKEENNSLLTGNLPGISRIRCRESFAPFFVYNLGKKHIFNSSRGERN